MARHPAGKGTDPVSEHQQAQIIAIAYSGGYAHAENILARLQQLEAEHGTDAAIDTIHSEVVE